MAIYFVDSSATVKLYILENGSLWMDRLADRTQGHQLIIARTTPVEVAAALFRRARGGLMPAIDADRAVQELERDLATLFIIVDLSLAVVASALQVARKYGLRGYDCVQLASALVVQRERLQRGLSPVTVVSSDAELNHAAQQEAIAVEDPNAHH